MPDIVLTTLNARYTHCAFGLRYLKANLGVLRDHATIAEFDISQRPVDVVEAIVALKPRIVGIGVYIWNIAQSTQLVATLKRVAPQIQIVLGGPEVSHETDGQEIVQWADYTITGEADLAFAELCEKLLAGQKPLLKIIRAELPGDLANVKMPYDLYEPRDIEHRVVYVEASRGCPFKCEFCLSSLDVPLRNFPLDAFLAQMKSLLDQGLYQFKFVDRTFNLSLPISKAILQFFLDHYREGLFLHFEMVPDRLPESLREMIQKFPPGAMQLEVGIQTFDEEIAQRISRKQDNAKVEENLRWLRANTGVHVHADLIVGLPGESVENFAAGFDRLVALEPQEIQVGILKRLRGTPISRHNEAWSMVYMPHAPYEILSTSVIDFSMMQRLRRFARYWDIVSNSGNFLITLPLILHNKKQASAFFNFLALSDWLHAQTNQTHALALPRLVQLLFEFATDASQGNLEPRLVAEAIWQDYQRSGRSDIPIFLRPFALEHAPQASFKSTAPRRQARHMS